MSDTDMTDEIEIEFVDQLKCCVCQDTINEARILPCGHSQCTECITGCINSNDFDGLLECPQCKYSGPVRDVESLPCCAVMNELRGKMDSKEVDMDRSSQKVQTVFKCPICHQLLEDARSLPCGHSYCRKCLRTGTESVKVAHGSSQDRGKSKSKSNGGQQVSCQRCRELHELPAGGVDELPINFRINGIVEELKSGGRKKTRPRSGDLPWNGPNHGLQPRQSTGAVGPFEDVVKAKRRAQKGVEPMDWANGPGGTAAPAFGHRRPTSDDVDEQKKRAQRANSSRIQVFVELPNGKTIMIDANVNESVNNLKTKIKNAVQVDESQQMLAFAGRNLDRGTLTLQQCGIGNHATIRLSYRMRGGSKILAN